MHLVGFIIEMYYDAQPYERQSKNFITLIIIIIILMTDGKTARNMSSVTPKK